MNTQKVINSGFGEDVIGKMADHAFEQYILKGVDPSRLCFVFGGRRPSLFLKKALAKRAGGNILSPSFFTIEDFMRYVVEKQGIFARIPELEAAYLIYKLSKKAAPKLISKREGFAEFLPWAYEVLSFIDQADMENIPESALENVEANAEIGYDVPKNVNELLKNINEIRKAFHEELKSKKLCTRGLLYLLASEFAVRTDLAEFDAVIFGNLFYLHKTEEAVVKAVVGKGRAVLFFQGDSKDWASLRKLEKAFSCKISSEHLLPFAGEPPGQAEGLEEGQDEGGKAEFSAESHPHRFPLPSRERKGSDISIICGYDAHSQAAAAREALQKFENSEKTVLILPDSDRLMPVLSELSGFEGGFNVSLGYPLKRSSLYSLIGAVLRAQTTKKGREYHVKDYLSAFLHPLAKNLKVPFDPNATRILAHAVERALTCDKDSKIAGRVYIDPEEILKEEKIFVSAAGNLAFKEGPDGLKRIFTGLNRLLFGSWENAGTIREFADAMGSFIENFERKSFAGYYPLNPEAAERTADTCEELKNSSFAREKLPKEAMTKIILKRLENEVISFSGSPLSGLQVLGALESRSLSFDNVVIMDVNESAMPKIKLIEPLVPRDVMLTLGMDRVEKEEEIQRYEFMRLVKGAKNAVLIYSENEKQEKSRFIEEIVWQAQKKGVPHPKTTKVGFVSRPKAGKRGWKKTPETMEHLARMKYTATNLDAYLACPANFYFSHVLRLKERQTAAEKYERARIGNFIHEFLFKAFRKFEGKRPDFGREFEKGFFESLDAAFEAEFAPKTGAGAFLVREVLFHRMKNFIDKERTRDYTRILCLEKQYSETFRFGGGDFCFESRVDRIDEAPDGSALIIDYKTGSTEGLTGSAKGPGSAEPSIDSIRKHVGSFQLPVYMMMAGKPYKKVNAALYDLRETELKHYVKPENSDMADEKMDFCRKALGFVLAEINDPERPFEAEDSEPQRCGHCPYFSACR
ncbi:MAG: PD-(D/E)XK nuclease family protein [Endomicrobiales bacterium]|nr:PD-(D/E)XK nuclease family protein [Endomicrobiales bacterium]